MVKEDIIHLVEKNVMFQEKIFARGFYFTNDSIDRSNYPFYNNWELQRFGEYSLLTAPNQKAFVYESGVYTFILIGHAYNPYNMCVSEIELLKGLSIKPFLSKEFWEEFNCWTGIFTVILKNNSNIYICGDPTCMQTTFYCIKDMHIYISSHINCIGDLLNLKWDDYIKELTSYKFFELLGNSLPGNLTQFREVKRLIPNHYVNIINSKELLVKRFYLPRKQMLTLEEAADEAASILHNTLELISIKWKKPAISMTGGCDSKTTLACAKGLYDKFGYFSYISSDSEQVDAEAAHQICKSLGIKHIIYQIPMDDNKLPDIEAAKKILTWNSGNIIAPHPNDVRKRVFFDNTEDFDVEVKSWASEIGRAYYSKRFNGRTNFGIKPEARVCTTLYKFFLHNRKLVKQTDQIFYQYINSYFQQDLDNPVEWQDQFFWEFRVASWNSMVITGEHRYSFDITIPYNNRKLFEILLSVPIENRINDTVYKMIRTKMNPNIDATGIAVTNLKHTKNREKAENIYYIINSKLWF